MASGLPTRRMLTTANVIDVVYSGMEYSLQGVRFTGEANQLVIPDGSLLTCVLTDIDNVDYTMTYVRRTRSWTFPRQGTRGIKVSLQLRDGKLVVLTGTLQCLLDTDVKRVTGESAEDTSGSDSDDSKDGDDDDVVVWLQLDSIKGSHDISSRSMVGWNQSFGPYRTFKLPAYLEPGAGDDFTDMTIKTTKFTSLSDRYHRTIANAFDESRVQHRYQIPAFTKLYYKAFGAEKFVESNDSWFDAQSRKFSAKQTEIKDDRMMHLRKLVQPARNARGANARPIASARARRVNDGLDYPRQPRQQRDFDELSAAWTRLLGTSVARTEAPNAIGKAQRTEWMNRHYAGTAFVRTGKDRVFSDECTFNVPLDRQEFEISAGTLMRLLTWPVNFQTNMLNALVLRTVQMFERLTSHPAFVEFYGEYAASNGIGKGEAMRAIITGLATMFGKFDASTEKLTPSERLEVQAVTRMSMEMDGAPDCLVNLLRECIGTLDNSIIVKALGGNDDLLNKLKALMGVAINIRYSLPNYKENECDLDDFSDYEPGQVLFFVMLPHWHAHLLGELKAEAHARSALNNSEGSTRKFARKASAIKAEMSVIPFKRISKKSLSGEGGGRQRKSTVGGGEATERKNGGEDDDGEDDDEVDNDAEADAKEGEKTRERAHDESGGDKDGEDGKNVTSRVDKVGSGATGSSAKEGVTKRKAKSRKVSEHEVYYQQVKVECGRYLQHLTAQIGLAKLAGAGTSERNSGIQSALKDLVDFRIFVHPNGKEATNGVVLSKVREIILQELVGPVFKTISDGLLDQLKIAVPAEFNRLQTKTATWASEQSMQAALSPHADAGSPQVRSVATAIVMMVAPIGISNCKSSRG